MSDNEKSSVTFNKNTIRLRNKGLRKRKVSSSEDSGEDEHQIREKVQEMKLKQKSREKRNGIDITLASGENLPSDKSSMHISAVCITQFDAETNRRDVDEEMIKYIEEKIAKKKNKNVEGSELGAKKKYYSPEDAALEAVPEHLRQSSTHTSEEMLSNQMLSGIPEVDLGIEAKIRNIEATEEAKLKLLWDRHRKKEGPSQFVPTNMAVNFVNINNINEVENKKRKSDQKEKKFSQQPRNKNSANEEKATDDYHYERFKKQFRRF